MFKKIHYKMLGFHASFLVGIMAYADEAYAAGGINNDFSRIARNITTSVEELPGLIASLSYIIGMLMGVMGVIKIKDHVENPTQTPMKEGAVRLAAGGALFGLPMVFESMLNTIGTTTATVEPARLSRATFTLF